MWSLNGLCECQPVAASMIASAETSQNHFRRLYWYRKNEARGFVSLKKNDFRLEREGMNLQEYGVPAFDATQSHQTSSTRIESEVSQVCCHRLDSSGAHIRFALFQRVEIDYT